MTRGSGSFDSNWTISLLVLALAGAVGFGLPALQGGTTPPDPGLAWTPPGSPTVAAADRPSHETPAAPSLPSEIIDAPAGAVLAWQEPAPATPSSVPIPSPTAAYTAAPPTPAATASQAAAEYPPNRAELALSGWTAPVATNTPEPAGTPVTSSQPMPPKRNPPERMPAATSTPAAARLAPARPSGVAPTVAQPSIAVPPAVAMPPELIIPPVEGRLAGVVQFVWQPTSALPDGAFYEVVVWSPEQDPGQAWGVAPPVRNQSLWINLDDLFRSGRFREGNLYWTVLVVTQEPYRRLTRPIDGEQRYLVYATGG